MRPNDNSAQLCTKVVERQRGEEAESDGNSRGKRRRLRAVTAGPLKAVGPGCFHQSTHALQVELIFDQQLGILTQALSYVVTAVAIVVIISAKVNAAAQGAFSPESN